MVSPGPLLGRAHGSRSLGFLYGAPSRRTIPPQTASLFQKSRHSTREASVKDSAASGSFHVRNEHANVQYRINGIMLPDGLSGFGPILDTSLIGILGRFRRSMACVRRGLSTSPRAAALSIIPARWGYMAEAERPEERASNTAAVRAAQSISLRGATSSAVLRSASGCSVDRLRPVDRHRDRDGRGSETESIENYHGEHRHLHQD